MVMVDNIQFLRLVFIRSSTIVFDASAEDVNLTSFEDSLHIAFTLQVWHYS